MRIVLLTVLISAPSAIVALQAAQHLRDSRLELIRTEALGIARVAAYAQREALDQVDAQLRYLAESSKWNSTSACGQEFYELVELAPIYFRFAVAEPDGRVKCSTAAIDATTSLGDRSYFREAVETKRASMSAPIQSRVSNTWTVVAAQPVVRDGTVQAVIAAGLNLAWTQDLLESLKLPENTIVSISHRDGRIIARSPSPDLFVGKRIIEAEAFSKTVETQSEGYAYSAGLDGIARQIAFVRIPDTSFFVRVGIPISEIDAAASETLRNGLMMLAASLMLVGLIGWSASRHLVVAPIRKLFDTTDKIGSGDWTARTGVDYVRHIVGPLARKIDELAAVGQRTIRAYRTLSAGNRAAHGQNDEIALVKAMCRVAVESGGYRFAFVGYRHDDARRSVEQIASFGDGADFNVVAAPTWGSDARGQGTVGTAIRTGRPDVVRSVASNPRFELWRDELLRRGFAAIASLPLKIDGETIGTLTLVASDDDAFDGPELALLEELADDLSSGIRTIRETARRSAAEALAERALTHDALTSLPNRILFLRNLAKRLDHNDPSRRTFIATLHLPALQEIFDGFGYILGNTIVRDLANRLRTVPGVEGTLARTATNEFALVIEADDEIAAGEVAQALAAASAASVEIDGRDVHIPVTVGTSIHPIHGSDGDDLLRRSAIAARDCVRSDKSYAVYRGMSDQEYAERLALTADLRAAVAQRTLSLNFQPKVAVGAETPCGAEALLRWQHPKRGFVSPAQFIPVSESSGLIRPIAYLVVEMALAQVSAWRDAGIVLPVAINLSTKNLLDGDFINWLEQQMRAPGSPGNLIEVEVTESALAEDPDRAKDVLTRLSALGTKLYIDDFGTGYSSLGYLATLPFHALKIDRSFVRAMGDSTQARLVVASMISMAHAMGMRVVAEGVETQDELARLADLGCDEIQGYLFSKPLDPDAFRSKFGGSFQ